METLFRVALCALLLRLGPVDCAEPPGFSGNETSLNTTGQVQTVDTNSNDTSSISINTTRGNDTTSKPTNSSGADVSPPSLVPDTNGNSTTHLSPQPPTTFSNHSTTVNTPTLPTIGTIPTVTFASSTPQTKTPLSNHSTSVPPASTAPSKQSTQNGTSSPTTVPKTASPAATTQPSSTHPPANTTQTSRHPETPSKPQSTVGPVNSTPTQTKIHSESPPSQLSIGGNTAVAPDAPALDPLMAGLVSAFIVTAVIITLLIFLKLRRRHSGPAFRRLQELPMDDMEDTPLYSY